MIDGSVRAVLDANRELLEKQIRSNTDDQKVSRPGKIGTAIPIQRLLEVWAAMPTALREQLEQSDRLWKLLGELISAGSSVPPSIAREVFDMAERELRSWPDRNGAASFGDCVEGLAALESGHMDDREYDPLAEYVRRVAERIDDPDLAAKSQKIATDAGFQASVVPEIAPRAIVGESRQTLVIRIIPDVDAIAETGGSGPRLRLLPSLLEQRAAPCHESCFELECRSRPIVDQTRLTFLGRHVLETSTGDLCEDLRGQMPDLFREFVGGVPDRVEIFLPRAYAASVLNSGLDRILFCLDFQSQNEPGDSLNAWTIVCHHIDERLQKTDEWKRLAERLGSYPGTLRLTKQAKSLAQLAKSPKPLYDSVVIDQERSSEVLHHLRSRRSLLCARSHSRDSVRCNLATAVVAPVPFIAVARSSDAVGTLDRLLKKKSCLRQLPHTLKDQIAAMSEWYLYTKDQPPKNVFQQPLPAPPWRQFAGLDGKSPGLQQRRGQTYQPTEKEIEAVNAAIHMRRPLLLTGDPGSGKSSLAYSVAWRLELGEVLYWPINSKTLLEYGLYQYDAIARLRDANLSKTDPETQERLHERIERYLKLGPLGTALAPRTDPGDHRPRILLIDELDKSDIDLPNDLLHVFEEGFFVINEFLAKRHNHEKLANDQLLSALYLTSSFGFGSKDDVIELVLQNLQ
jgi:hypothetical protein